MKWLQEFSGSPKGTYIVVFLFIAVKLWHIHHFHHLYPDKSRQIAAASQLLQGKGYLKCVADSSNLTQVHCEPESGWPVGYSLILSKTVQLTGWRWLFAAYVMDIAATLLLISALLFLVLRLLVLERKAKNLLLLFLTLSFTPFHYLSTTELAALACWLFALGCMLLYGRHGKLLYLFGLSLCMIVAVFLRYAYLPILAVFPAYLMVKHCTSSTCRLTPWAALKEFTLSFLRTYSLPLSIYSLPIALYLYLIQVFYPTIEKGVSGYEEVMSNGWLWGSILKTSGFLTETLFYITPFLIQLEKHPFYPFINGFSQLITILLLCFFVGHIYVQGFREGKQEVKANFDFYLLGLLTFVFSFGLLAYMSLTIYQPQGGIYDNYAFVQEARHHIAYAIVMLVFVWATQDRYKLLKIVNYFALLYGFIFTSYLFFQIDIQGKKDFKGTYNYYHGDFEAFAECLWAYKKQASGISHWATTLSLSERERILTGIGVYPLEIAAGSFLSQHSLPSHTALLLPSDEWEQLPDTTKAAYTFRALCGGGYGIVEANRARLSP